MSRPTKNQNQVTEENICEVIELASADVELLARAFKMIDAACQGQVCELVDELDPAPCGIPEHLLN